MTVYYLSSLDSTRLAPVRSCRFEEVLHFDTGKTAVRATLDPAVPGQRFDGADDVRTVVLTTRHDGASLDPVDAFPCFVFVAVPRTEGAGSGSPVRAEDLTVIGWGELYRSREDAEGHVFG